MIYIYVFNKLYDAIGPGMPQRLKVAPSPMLRNQKKIPWIPLLLSSTKKQECADNILLNAIISIVVAIVKTNGNVEPFNN